MSSLAELRTQTRELIDEDEAANSNFTDAQIDGYLNRAVKFLGTQMEWAEQIITTPAVADSALYELPDNFISLVDVYFDNNPLLVVERLDLKSIAPDWQNAPSSTPQYAYRADVKLLGLYPAPDANQADKLIQVQYIKIPATLSADGDIPDLHSSFQLCLPFYAAFLCEGKLGNDKKSQLNLSYYEQHRKALMSKVQSFSPELMRFRW
jgi:hypothetical protein